MVQAESIIFDMDGTLWDSAENVARSWNEVLKQQPDTDITLSEADIKGVMGMPMDAIAKKLFPDVSRGRQMALLDACGLYENDYLKKHGGTLYPGVEETLKKLSGKHRLFIVSNCQSGYIEAFLEYYGFAGYFTDILCWGDTKLSKGETIARLMEKNHISDAVYVGDTQGDCTSTYEAGAKFIYAAYGFGKVDRCDGVIHDIRELPDMVKGVSE